MVLVSEHVLAKGRLLGFRIKLQKNTNTLEQSITFGRQSRENQSVSKI